MSYNSESNRARNLKLCDFEITRLITPWIVLHSVQLLLLIIIIIIKIASLIEITTNQTELQQIISK